MSFDEKSLVKSAISSETVLHPAITLRQTEADKIHNLYYSAA